MSALNIFVRKKLSNPNLNVCMKLKKKVGCKVTCRCGKIQLS